MDQNYEIIKLMVTIVDRGIGSEVVDLYRLEDMHFDFACLGFGTASSHILNFFGLDETEKDVVLTTVPASRIPDLMRKVDLKFRMRRPGNGILFTLPLSGISAQIPRVLCKPEYVTKKEGTPMEESNIQYDLIVTIVNQGHTNHVMDAARAAGARGGTTLHARRVGYEDAQNMLGFTIQPEKEIIAILAPRAKKHAMMQAISAAAGITTESRGLLFSMQVDDILGLQLEKIPVPQE